MPLSIVILAAGQGSRMKSSKPKVLHKLAGRPLLGQVIETAKSLEPEQICVVYGHGGDEVRDYYEDDDALSWALQEQQLGTGHAVEQALPHLNLENTILILYGDVPLIRHTTLTELSAIVNENTIGLLTVNLDDPTGYGRILRNDDNEVTGIIEHKDASEQQRAINEVNTGIMAVEGLSLKQLIGELDNNNAQSEYYLTDIIALQRKKGKTIDSRHPDNVFEVEGVNTKQQLAQLERVYQENYAKELMAAGVIMADPSRFDCRGQVSIGEDTFIDVNVVIEGKVSIGEGCKIEPNVVIRNSTIGDEVVIKANSVLENAVVKKRAQVGPFARLRPGTSIGENAMIGNFVEVKNTLLGDGSKASHLSYVGDATVGENVNIGAGTITCNYDGANKHKTVLEDNVFVGSDTQLVAPVTVGAGATIAAGTTVTKDVPPEQLVLSRVKQKLVSDWQRPQKEKK